MNIYQLDSQVNASWMGLRLYGEMIAKCILCLWNGHEEKINDTAYGKLYGSLVCFWKSVRESTQELHFFKYLLYYRV
jgi:hypothetical protein